MTSDTIRVAIVDDDPGYLRALERLLSAAGYLALGYASAESFLAESPQVRVDCAVLDIQLGTMTGFDLARRLAAGGSRAPVIFITAHDDAQCCEQAREAGAAYLRKPFSARLLIDAIERAVSARSGEPGG